MMFRIIGGLVNYFAMETLGEKKIVVVMKDEIAFKLLLREILDTAYVKPAIFYGFEQFGSKENLDFDYLFIDVFFLNEFFCSAFVQKKESKINSFENVVFYGLVESFGTKTPLKRTSHGRCFYLKMVSGLKPFHPNEIFMENKTSLETTKEGKDEFGLYKVKDSIFVKSNHYLDRIDIDSIICFESNGNYLTVYTQKKKYVIRKTLSNMHTMLPSRFVKINRSLIVNVMKIERIEGNKLILEGLEDFRPLLVKGYKSNVFEKIPLLN